MEGMGLQAKTGKNLLDFDTDDEFDRKAAGGVITHVDTAQDVPNPLPAGLQDFSDPAAATNPPNPPATAAAPPQAPKSQQPGPSEPGEIVEESPTEREMLDLLAVSQLEDEQRRVEKSKLHQIAAAQTAVRAKRKGKEKISTRIV